MPVGHRTKDHLKYFLYKLKVLQHVILVMHLHKIFYIERGERADHLQRQTDNKCLAN